MKSPLLTVRRHPYEEPYHTQLAFIVCNNTFSGATDIYCNVEDIAVIGEALKTFPKQIPDEYIYEYGSSDPTTRFYRHFKMRAYTTDNRGHCAIQFSININEAEPQEGICTFSLVTDPAGINRLGVLFNGFAALKHLELQWSPTEGELYEHHQTTCA